MIDKQTYDKYLRQFIVKLDKLIHTHPKYTSISLPIYEEVITNPYIDDPDKNKAEWGHNHFLSWVNYRSINEIYPQLMSKFEYKVSYVRVSPYDNISDLIKYEPNIIRFNTIFGIRSLRTYRLIIFGQYSKDELQQLEKVIRDKHMADRDKDISDFKIIVLDGYEKLLHDEVLNECKQSLESIY